MALTPEGISQPGLVIGASLWRDEAGELLREPRLLRSVLTDRWPLEDAMLGDDGVVNEGDEGPTAACSYSPLGRKAGNIENWLFMRPWMRCIAIAKSVESRAPRFSVSESSLESG